MLKNADEDNTEFPVPVTKRLKRSGMDFYINTLGAPKLVVSRLFAYTHFYIVIYHFYSALLLYVYSCYYLVFGHMMSVIIKLCNKRLN